MATPEKILKICLDKKNINSLLDIVREEVSLSDKSLQSCEVAMQRIMTKNVPRLNKMPKDVHELRKVIQYFNKLCVSEIMDIVSKKYPERLNRQNNNPDSSTIGKGRLRRELDVFGERDSHVLDRPGRTDHRTRDFDDDDDNFSKKKDGFGSGCIDNISQIGGLRGYQSGDSGNYAAAFSSVGITGINDDNDGASYNQQYRDQDRNSDYGNYGNGNNNYGNSNYGNGGGRMNQDQIQGRLESYIDNRNRELNTRNKPPTPDFTLDGSGHRIKQQKEMRRMQQLNESGGNMYGSGGGFSGNGFGSGFGGSDFGGGYGSIGGGGCLGGYGGLDGASTGSDISYNPYDSLLGAGAPGRQQSQQHPQQMQYQQPIYQQQMQYPQYQQQMQYPQYQQMQYQPQQQPQYQQQMGILDQMSASYNNPYDPSGRQISAKQQQFDNDLEKKIAERKMVDFDTGQPNVSKTDNYNQGYQPDIMSMQMPMYVPPMQTMQMTGMYSQSMPMSGMC